MFANKIEGRNRQILLCHLCTLYSEGYRCLLRCPSLNVELTQLLQIQCVLRTAPTPSNLSNSKVALEIFKESLALYPFFC